MVYLYSAQQDSIANKINRNRQLKNFNAQKVIIVLLEQQTQ